MDAILLGLAVVALLGVFATTRMGRQLLVRTPLRDRVPGAAPREDVAYLLQLCGGDRDEVARALALEREQTPDLSEAQHYRRAIRKRMRSRPD